MANVAPVRSQGCPGMDESAVALERAEVVSVGSQADIAVGAHCVSF